MKRRFDFSKFSRSQLSNVIDEWVHDERDRKILKRRLLDGVCFERLAEEFDLSYSQIKRIIYKYDSKIAAYKNDT